MQKAKYAILGVLVLVVVVAAASIAVDADRPRLKASSKSPALRALIPTDLPPVDRLPQQVSLDKVQSVLQFDDGSCESGLGANTTITSWVDFDVPTQCVMGGLQVIQATGRFNTAGTGTAQVGLLGQAGAAPPAVGSGTILPLSGGPFNAAGPCPGNAVQQKALVVPGVVAGTSNFFFGIRHGGFWGRDTDGVPAGRIWLGCGLCGQTQYSPALLDGAGFGGNWMLRVTVEDTDCLPAELEGACCTSQVDCIIETAGNCGALGGSFKGAGSDCVDPLATCQSLYVSMNSMKAVQLADGSVAIRWTTEAEVDTVGFRVLREDNGRMTREKANRVQTTVVAAMIPAQGAGLTGSSYEVVDGSPDAARATVYWIEDIDLMGRVTRHGPIEVERGARTRTR